METSKSKVNVLIVEDDIILANDIAIRLAVLNFHSIGIAPTVNRAVELLNENQKIDIVLIDIILKGTRDGIDLARIIKSEYNLPFIFLTSHMDEVIVNRAKGVGAYAYILKPFNDRQVSIAIELALVNYANKTPETDLLTKKEFSITENRVLQINDSLFLKKDSHFERVLINEILYLQADSNYTTIHTNSGRFVYSTVLKKIEAMLPTNFFLRVHRSFVVNIKCITGFEGNLIYVKQEKIPVSKSHHDEVFRLFRRL
ncbi:MAG: DNA-binding response regulator [Flavobacteriaceae bacterium]|nr:MAG: DNA-binding response regulator [Flavobacteriaceae bacterium]